MDSPRWNQLLIHRFPELDAKYRKEITWGDGEIDDPGTHVIYSDVFADEIEKLLESGDLLATKGYFAFIEELLDMGDKYIENVVTVSVLENLFYSTLDRNQVKKLLGPAALKIWKGYEQFDANQKRVNG